MALWPSATVAAVSSETLTKKMWIPTKLYEGLPALYLTVGALNILGAMYIDISYGLMPGYAVLGLACMIAGMLVRNIRRNARSGAKPPPA